MCPSFSYINGVEGKHREHTQHVTYTFECRYHIARVHETTVYEPPWLSQPWFYCTICQRTHAFAWRPMFRKATRFETISACVSLYPGLSNVELEVMLGLPSGTIKYYLKKYPGIFRAKKRGRINQIFIKNHKWLSVTRMDD